MHLAGEVALIVVIVVETAAAAVVIVVAVIVVVAAIVSNISRSSRRTGKRDKSICSSHFTLSHLAFAR
ncbi:hypothetical protein ElyMa_003545800 [Elysia marginata]|uniref:Secreted peptide n=1 Tax=Elysia marginata TaxID=1093978 RepID=A0AAV4EJT1_9GAST|nr:hypothetical protein ElyMa_003545800 [Elysia marginata]